MEAGKSPVLHSESQEGQWCSSSQMASRLETQEELRFQFESKVDVLLLRPSGRKNSLLLGRESTFCCIQIFDWLDEAIHIRE